MLQYLTRVLGFRSKATSTKRSQRTNGRRQFQPKVEALETREVPTATLVDGGDINVGLNSSSPRELVDVNGTLFFSADEGIFGRELWRRTPGGKVERVRDIRPGSDGSDPLHLTAVGRGRNAVLYFSADDGQHGRELWKATQSGGAEFVKDIYLGEVGSDPSELIEFRTTVNRNPQSYLYFAATDVLHGRELWRSVPAANGLTDIVADINLGPADSDPAYLTVANTKDRRRPTGRIRPFLFFRADDGRHGAELWRTTVSRIGAQVAPILVEDIRIGLLGSDPFNLTKVGRLTTEQNYANDQFFPDRLFFGANDGLNGAELWRSMGFGRETGFDPGTHLVRDINPGDADSLEPSPIALMANFVGRTRIELYFAADDGFFGRELWKASQLGGAELVKDINPGPDSSDPTAQAHPLPERRTLILKKFGQDRLLLFGANDGLRGSEPWRTNGRTLGTIILKDINVGPNSSLIQNELIGIVVPRTKQPNSTTRRVYFAADDGFFGRELWIGRPLFNNGVTVGVSRDTDINPGPPPSTPSDFEISRGKVFFAAEKALLGRELWQVFPNAVSSGASGGSSSSVGGGSASRIS